MRPFIVLTLVLSAALVPAVAGAHTELESTAPAANQIVSDPPIEVVLTFTQPPRADPPPAVRVVDPNGDDLVSAPPTLDGAVVTVPLNLAVAPGDHVVDWAITAADGDDQTGTFTFVFEPPSEVATPQPATPTEPAPAAEPTTATNAAVSIETPATPASTETPALVGADPAASSTATRALIVVAAFFAVAGVGAVMLRRGRGEGTG